MNTSIDARQIKENASIVALLAALGFQPAKKTGNEHLYYSPLRDNDTSPSFSVNDSLGCWFDHGAGKGGNIIDFGLRYWPGLGFPQVVEKIAAAINLAPAAACGNKRKRSAIKQPNYQILEVKDLGSSRAIEQYLRTRGVLSAAQGLLKEVYYYIEDQQKNRKKFFAAGWQNELGGWEVRNLYFKGCIGRKAISFIPGDQSRLCVFEGFIDYLSWLTNEPFCEDSILVLNSIALLQSGISKARPFQHISTYFDNDPSGRAATAAFKEVLPQTVDHSWIYEGYNDYNDLVTAIPLRIDPGYIR
jgi:hypothetical protein